MLVLYGCETWSLTLNEEIRLRVFENRVLRVIFGPKRDDMTREWRKLHNDELNDLYSSPNIVRVIISSRIRWAGHVARMGEKREVYTGFWWGKKIIRIIIIFINYNLVVTRWQWLFYMYTK